MDEVGSYTIRDEAIKGFIDNLSDDDKTELLTRHKLSASIPSIGETRINVTFILNVPKIEQNILESLDRYEKSVRIANFLYEYNKLITKYGIYIDGCGCCDSPFLNDIEYDDDIRDHIEHLVSTDTSGTDIKNMLEMKIDVQSI